MCDEENDDATWSMFEMIGAVSIQLPAFITGSSYASEVTVYPLKVSEK